MRSTCTSREASSGLHSGFTVIELLIGLALAMCLAVVAAPLWLSLESVGVREADRTVESLQGRVAMGRLERDLRLASGAGCPFMVETSLLEATADQVVFLGRAEGGAEPVLVEWELTGGALMRRWGVCPKTRPVVFRHSLYRDHKTMLEKVESGGAFAYMVDGELITSPVPESDLDSVEAVILNLNVGNSDESGSVEVATVARVSR